MYVVGGPVFRLKDVILFGRGCTWPCRAGSCLATRPHVQAEKAVLAEWNHVSPLSVTMASQESPETRSSLVTSWTCASFEDVIIQFDDILCALPTSESMFWTRTCKHQPSAKSCAMIFKTSLSFLFLWIPALHQPSPYWDLAFTDENRGGASAVLSRASKMLIIEWISCHCPWSDQWGPSPVCCTPFFVCLGAPSIDLDHDRC